MDSKVKHLLSLQAVRERSQLVGQLADEGKLTHFNLHEDKLDAVADFVTSIIERDFGPDKYHNIPPHGRWQHFEVNKIPRIANLLKEWKDAGVDDTELTRRLIDLFFVSVLLDAGAGDNWRYVEPGTETKYERSEGIAVASLYMFKALDFAADKAGESPLVDGKGLQQLETKTLAEGFQISESNPMLGVDSRAGLLRSLGSALLAHPEYFGEEGRPGKLVDYMLKTIDENNNLDVLKFWDVIQTALIPIWPQDRTTVNGQPIGDAWPLSTLKKRSDVSDGSDESEFIQPFHKLTQWLTYSLMVPFQRILRLQWINANCLTALPEYRNGGLFVDLGALTLKPEALERGLKASNGPLPLFDAGDDVIVEWRAMTLVLVDKLHSMVTSRMNGVQLTLAQMLEAGTWKSGREIAAKLRPETKSSPILIRSDGTLF